MKYSLLKPLVAALMSLGVVGVVYAQAPQEPDLDNPKVLKKILAAAVLRETLEVRRAERKKLIYAPNSQTPYTGWAKRVDGNGKVISLGHCREGKPDGLLVWWHANGTKRQENHFKDGKEEGLATVWHENGQKAGEITYKAGKKEGLETNWHENGEKKAEISFKNGKQNGLATLWDENGKMIRQVHFKNGKQVGETGRRKKE